MLKSTGYVLAAGAIVVANDALFVPINEHKAPWTDLNWRVVPATAVMALILGGVEKMAPSFGAGLGALVLISVLVIPYGGADPPLTNLAKTLGYIK